VSAVKPKTVLVAGASGVIGQAAVAHFARSGVETIALSRRRPDLPEDLSFRHMPVDLRDSQACAEAISGMAEVSHLVFSALYEKPGLVAGWRDPEQMAVNLAMLRNLLDPLSAKGGLRHVSLLQGTKAYGVHIHRIPVPAKESWPRDPHENFYWLQEDHLRETADGAGFGFTIFRPQIVFGDPVGVAMNITPLIGVYAAIRREEGSPFSYPGGPDYVLEAVDAHLIARALDWAGEAAGARNETFNITNGDVFVWRNIWPALADAVGMEMGSDEPLSLAEWLPAKEEIWDRIVAKHGLQPLPLTSLLGQSHHYADFCMASGVGKPPPPVLVSTIKLRQAGFADCIDTETMFREQLSRLVAKKILPPPRL
jgi:nucleoside-diphosphate-sugar epimerase